MKKILYIVIAVSIAISCAEEKKPVQKVYNPKKVISTNKVVLSSEIEWEKLNPARGDKSPLAGTVWGDRKDTVATGFLAKFVDGFSSPPHIHNVTYRAVVIKGLIHNDDPNATAMWMPKGSFWTQPAGEAHITSAKGKENIAYVEIDSGPYLVKPIDQAFDNGERPVNIDASNVVWVTNKATNWISVESNAEISFLWKSNNNDGLQGFFVKLPKQFTGEIVSDGEVFHAVLVQGELHYTLPQNRDVKILDPGSYFTATDEAIHRVANETNDNSILYIRTNGDIKVKN